VYATRIWALLHLPRPVAAKDGVNLARIDRGRTLIHQHRCDVCHNPDLSGRENVPRIAGQREDYLLKVLRGYKDNTRPGYDASMDEVLQPISEEDIRDLAYILLRGNLRDQPAPLDRRVHCRSSIFARVSMCTRTGRAKR
jgi:cytochrome c553